MYEKYAREARRKNWWWWRFIQARSFLKQQKSENCKIPNFFFFFSSTHENCVDAKWFLIYSSALSLFLLFSVHLGSEPKLKRIQPLTLVIFTYFYNNKKLMYLIEIRNNNKQTAPTIKPVSIRRHFLLSSLFLKYANLNHRASL